MTAGEPESIVSDLKAAKSASKGRQPRTLLPSPPPTPGAPREQVAGWLTVALGLGADPISRAERYGAHTDSRIVLVLASGRRVTFERQADAFDPARLVQVVMTATGAQLPAYQRADVLHLAGSMIRLADLLADDDSRGEAAEWGRTFLEGAERNVIQVTDVTSAHGRWEALATLTSWNPPAELPPYAPAAMRSCLLADAAGRRMLRTSDFAAHARAQAGRPVPWAALHGRMLEVGWQHPGEIQQRQPGGQGKAKARVYVVGAGWEHE